MPGWRSLLRAALALLATAAVWSALIAAASVFIAGRKGMDLPRAQLAWTAFVETLPMFLAASAAAVLPALLLLVAIRRLTLVRLMLWGALAALLAFEIWAVSQGAVILTGSHGFQAASAVIFGFFNAGLFGLLAAVWRWPAAKPA